MKFLVFVIGASLLLGISCSSADGFQGELIFPQQGQHCHGSSLILLPNGDLLSCWFQGSGERSANDVRILGARMKKGTHVWSKPFLMADTPGLPDCNPVLFLDRKARLWLFYIPVVANRWENCLLKYRRSEDYLQSGPPQWNWQDVIILKPGDAFPRILKQGFKDMGFNQGCWAEYAHPYDELLVQAAQDKQKRQMGWMTRIHPVTLGSGRILLPLYSDGFNLSMCAYSDNDGRTWNTAPIMGLGPIQPSFAQRKDGVLIAFMRDSGGPPQRIMVSRSVDQGATWSLCQDLDIPNPSSSLEVVTLKNGIWVLICNDTERGRNRLAAYLSPDEGRTWTRRRYLERAEHGKASYAYPSVIVNESGNVDLTYSYGNDEGQSIKHGFFTVDWLMNGEKISRPIKCPF